MAVEDLLDDELKENNIRIYVHKVFQAAYTQDLSFLVPKSRTYKIAKWSVRDVYDTFRKAIEHYETRGNIPANHKVCFTEEDPDLKLFDKYNIIITASLVSRQPGAYSQGSPGEGKVKNRNFRFRETLADEENPGYNLATVGYWHDNVIRLTVWCRTNKEANQKADWLEDLMEEYAWWFKAEGIDRVFFNERQPDILREIDNVKLYGRPLDYFVRTEKIRVISEKTIEQIVINLTLDDGRV